MKLRSCNRTMAIVLCVVQGVILLSIPRASAANPQSLRAPASDKLTRKDVTAKDVRTLYVLRPEFPSDRVLILGVPREEEREYAVRRGKWPNIYLYSIHRDQYKRIDSLEELGGLVRIKHERDALNLVRLRTIPFALPNFSSPPAIEILIDEEVNGAVEFGSYRVADNLREISNGYRGVIPKKRADALGVRGPVIVRNRDGYVIERYLLLQDNGFWIQLVRETVSHSGHYSFEVVSSVKDVTGGNWSFPSSTWGPSCFDCALPELFPVLPKRLPALP